MTVSYRRATHDDAAALAELGAQTFTDTFGHLYQPDDLEIFLQNHSTANWAKELGDPAFDVRIAERDGRLVGYVKLGPPHLPFEPRIRIESYVVRLHILPAAWLAFRWGHARE